MITSCVQTVLHLQPHTLEVSFATLQLLYQLCTGPVHPIPQQSFIDIICVVWTLTCKHRKRLYKAGSVVSCGANNFSPAEPYSACMDVV